MSLTTAPLLELEGLSISVAEESGLRDVVRDFNLCITPGETLALVGESGSGKSVTAQAILRLLPENLLIRTGQVRLEQRSLNMLSNAELRSIRGAKVGMIFQEPATSLNPVMRIGDQLTETLRLHTSLRGDALKARARAWLERVGIPDAAERLSDYPFQFSGGQRQRIMIAMALAAEPQLLIADEPTTALDVSVQAQILDLLRDIQQELGLAILLITHDLAVVKQMAHRIALMRHGQLVESATTERFFANPEHPYAQELLAAIPTFAKRGQPLLTPQPVVFKEAASTAALNDSLPPVSPSITHSVEVRASSEYVANVEASPEATGLEAEQTQPVLEVQDLCVSYKGKQRLGRTRQLIPVVKNLSLTLHRGETLALLGGSGCGKSTVAKSLMRLIDGQALQTGNIRVQSLTNVLQASTQVVHQMRQRMQIVFQDPFASLNPRMVTGDILAEGLRSLHPQLSKPIVQRRLQRLLDQTGLPANSLGRYPHEFSGGQRQRIAIARALAVEPSILICDEPTSALDVSVQAQILDLLTTIQRDTGLAYLFITHNFSVVEYFADRIAVMHEGKVIEQGDAAQVLLHPQHTHTRALLAAVPRL